MVPCLLADGREHVHVRVEGVTKGVLGEAARGPEARVLEDAGASGPDGVLSGIVPVEAVPAVQGGERPLEVDPHRHELLQLEDVEARGVADVDRGPELEGRHLLVDAEFPAEAVGQPVEPVAQPDGGDRVDGEHGGVDPAVEPLVELLGEGGHAVEADGLRGVGRAPDVVPGDLRRVGDLLLPLGHRPRAVPRPHARDEYVEEIALGFEPCELEQPVVPVAYFLCRPGVECAPGCHVRPHCVAPPLKILPRESAST